MEFKEEYWDDALLVLKREERKAFWALWLKRSVWLLPILLLISGGLYFGLQNDKNTTALAYTHIPPTQLEIDYSQLEGHSYTSDSKTNIATKIDDQISPALQQSQAQTTENIALNTPKKDNSSNDNTLNRPTRNGQTPNDRISNGTDTNDYSAQHQSNGESRTGKGLSDGQEKSKDDNGSPTNLYGENNDPNSAEVSVPKTETSDDSKADLDALLNGDKNATSPGNANIENEGNLNSGDSEGSKTTTEPKKPSITYNPNFPVPANSAENTAATNSILSDKKPSISNNAFRLTMEPLGKKKHQFAEIGNGFTLHKAEPKKLFPVKADHVFFELTNSFLTGYGAFKNRDNTNWSLALGYDKSFTEHWSASIAAGAYWIGGISKKVDFNQVELGFGKTFNTTTIAANELVIAHVPISLHYAFRKRIIFTTGVDLDYLINVKSTKTQSQSDHNGILAQPGQSVWGYSAGFNRFLPNAHLGIGFRLSENLTLTGNYHFGLTQVGKSAIYSTGQNDRNKRLEIGIRYQLRP